MFDFMYTTYGICRSPVMCSPDLKDSDWVPLANTFTQNLAKHAQQNKQDFEFSVEPGTSTASIKIVFCGRLQDEEDRSDLQEEMSFDKLEALHR